MRIIFSNTTGEFLIQAESKEYSFKATSGRNACMNNQSCEDKSFVGPTPAGAYYIIPTQLDDPNYFGDVMRRTKGDWGDFRIQMYPQAGTDTKGRTNMFIHGGSNLGSAGCIDIGGGLLGDKDSDMLKELIKKHVKQGAIRVDVINGEITEEHKNKSMQVIEPKNLRSDALKLYDELGSKEINQANKINKFGFSQASLDECKKLASEAFSKEQSKSNVM
jgi:hypothetical protein